MNKLQTALLTTVLGIAGAVAQSPIVMRTSPITSPVVVRNQATGQHLVVFEEGQPGQPAMLAAFEFDAQLGNPRLVLLANGTRPTATCASATGKWVIAYEVNDGIDVRLQPCGSAFGVGSVTHVASHVVRPQLGGYADPATRSGDVLLVGESIGLGTIVQGVIRPFVLDTRGASVAVSNLPDPATWRPNKTASHPTVTPLVWNESMPWCVAWQITDTNGVWSYVGIEAALIGRHGIVQPVTSVAERLGTPINPGSVYHEPRVAGSAEDYLFTYLSGGLPGSGIGDELCGVRVHWTTRGAQRDPETVLYHGQVAQDRTVMLHFTREHYGVAYRRLQGAQSTGTIARLGDNAAVVATRILPAGSVTGSIGMTWDGDRGFRHVWADNRVFPLVYADDLALDSAAGVTLIGSGCTDARIEFWGQPYAGSRRGRLALVGGPPNSLAVLFGSAAPSRIALAPFGMPGCLLFVDPSFLFVGDQVRTDASGTAWLEMRPEVTLHDMWFQFAHASGVNALGLVTTQGLRLSVR